MKLGPSKCSAGNRAEEHKRWYLFSVKGLTEWHKQTTQEGGDYQKTIEEVMRLLEHEHRAAGRTASEEAGKNGTVSEMTTTESTILAEAQDIQMRAHAWDLAVERKCAHSETFAAADAAGEDGGPSPAKVQNTAPHLASRSKKNLQTCLQTLA